MTIPAAGAAAARMTADGPAYLAAGTPLLTPHSLRSACDVIIGDWRDAPSAPQHGPATLAAFLGRRATLRDGAIVYVDYTLLDGFFAEALPGLRTRFVLVSAGTWSAPRHHHQHLDDPRLLRWFGQNCDLAAPHEKFTPVPLGLTESDLPHGDQAAMLRVHRRMPPVRGKPATAHASFHLTLSHPQRGLVWRALTGRPGIVFEPRRIPPELLWIHHARHAFAISPRGAGSDCHRTWEALLLRTIPIVQTSVLDPVYQGFPVVRVHDWREITPEAMALWQAQLGDGFTTAMFERLTADYWAARIRAAARS